MMTLTEKANALHELAERHFHPDTRHIGKDDYDLIMSVTNDLRSASIVIDAIHIVIPAIDDLSSIERKDHINA